MAIYNNERKALHELLAMASNDQGATLLIPDLQRPYVWGPASVRLLIDSLIRGWPFGTLLTWKVRADDPARGLARSFWRVVDRTEKAEGEDISQMTPPAPFHMVLDGQQRVQSLLLALGGDRWGFRLYDREWRTDLEEIKPQGPRGKPHWSLGCLCLDLPAFAEQYTAAKRSVVAIDYKKVLEWVILDPATGQSSLTVGSQYAGPLHRATDWPGRFVRLSRLWNKAPLADMVEGHYAEMLAAELLKEHGVDDDLLTAPVGSLLMVLGLVKRTPVTYLELQEYSAVHGPREVYNDAVVNIFTRLNSAGRTLTREDITFAWLKIGWNTGATNGDSAARCFEQLGEQLEEFDLSLRVEDLVSAVSFLWSVTFNEGRLLNNNDLLRAEMIRPMATNISENWNLVGEAMRTVSEIVRDRRLRYGEQYQSLSAMQFLWACYFAALLWRKDHTLKEPDKDALDKGLRDMLDSLADRWLICSGWAGLWATNFAVKFAALASRLNTSVEKLRNAPDVTSATAHLRQHVETEVNSLVADALGNGLNTMYATDRKQVRTYYTALWIWNRLDKTRWSMARIALRDKSRKHNGTDVDHVVAYALWQKKLQHGKEAGELTDEQLSEAGPAVNQLGNCLLLDKNFNISKSDRPLNEFLAKVYEFKQGNHHIADWASAMDLDMAQVDSNTSSLATLHEAFEGRTQKIRAELTDFIRGTRSRVDLEAAENIAAVTVATVGTPEQITATGGGRDPIRIAFIKSLKHRFSLPPLSDKFRCWGHKGRSYSCFLSFADQGEIYFGLDWDNPYLSVPINAGYDTAALADPVWQADGEEARWHDFGPTDLTNPHQCQTLLERVADLLGTIRIQEPVS